VQCDDDGDSTTLRHRHRHLDTADDVGARSIKAAAVGYSMEKDTVDRKRTPTFIHNHTRTHGCDWQIFFRSRYRERTQNLTLLQL